MVTFFILTGAGAGWEKPDAAVVVVMPSGS